MLALTALLVVALGAIVWQARARWNEEQVKRRNNLSVKVIPIAPPPLAPAPKPDAAPAIKYADVATKDLFAKDRTPTVIIDPPKAEEKKMPPLPVVYGVLGLPSGTKAIMAEKKGGTSRPVHAGDKIGEFIIASLDPQNVVFDWDGKQIPKKIEDLIDRSETAAADRGAAVPAAQAPVASRNNAPAAVPTPGTENSSGQRACVPGDNSPVGTVSGGYKKTGTPTPFGLTGCVWVKQ
jgi:hypothetical protein